MAGTLTISGNFPTGFNPAGVPIQLTINVPSPIGAITAVALASGFNSIAIPVGTTFYIIVLPVGNATSVTLKGITGDTGTALLPTGYNLLQVTSGQTTIGLTAGGAIAALTYIYFI